MADFSYDDVYGVEESPTGGSVTTIINWAGAVVSLALLGGLTAWGWQLLVRDVSGVPVITALEGPMRIAPENPGGEIADHQGLAVNRIPAVGEAAPGADTVVLAPAPARLTEEDAAMATLLPDMTEPVAEDAVAVDEGPVLSATDLAVLTALAELEPELVVENVLLTDEDEGEEAQPSNGTLASSPRPAPRPSDIGATALQFTSVSTASSGLDLSPDAIAPGTRLVQLGAFPSIEAAEAEWTRIDGAFADYMGDKRRVIQEAETGGKTFYRLRIAGFEGLSDARRFCAVLVAGDSSCIPVVAR